MSSATKTLCRVIVALDLDRQSDALQWVDRLGKHVDIFKVGLQLFSREGFDVVTAIIAKGKRVFLDLKFHDIPNTVAHAVKATAIPGVEFLTIHAAGGTEMMSAAVKAVQESSAQNPAILTRLLAVTVLTSLDDGDLRKIGVTNSTTEQVLNLAHLARSSGVTGIVSSPQEASLLRKKHGPELVLVTPGIRPTKTESQDQKRVMTPGRAIQEGSNFLVMGRSLLDVPDPLKTLQNILAEIG